jgi:acyl-CoA reductase-like NAD-dependent aldehyde dehydrogenase
VSAALLRNYARGEWLAADGVEALDDVDPSSGEVAARVPLSGAEQVRAKVITSRR